ncbi:COA8 family protein CG14806, mitochondrial [Culicoides brevitarsis]|uniref:COA8 family protein CG14806, mitochondrial n=1 Tax=Culicoides brevitarsis TaxID=469753 RepID=UPI00307C283B
MLAIRNLRLNPLQNEAFWIQINKYSSETQLLKKKESREDGFMEMPDPETIDRDYIGPPDKLSNLRPILRHKPQNETDAQRNLREKRLEVQEWNQKFWAGHNKRFFEEKEEYIQQHKRPGEDTLPADEMSKFYKYFLDKNWKIHVLYNISWYTKNFSLLFSALHVNLETAIRKIKGK